MGGMAYENFHERKVEMFSHQKARFTMRFLLRRTMATKIVGCLCGQRCARWLFTIPDPDGLQSPQTDSEDEDSQQPARRMAELDDASKYTMIVDKQREILDDLNRPQERMDGRQE